MRFELLHFRIACGLDKLEVFTQAFLTVSSKVLDVVS